MRHIISILMQNEAGALARVAALFSSRGYNIESLSVAPTEDHRISRLTLVTSGSDQVVEQINNQLLKLVDVVNTADMTRDDHIERELLLMKLKIEEETSQTLRDLIGKAGARVLDDCPETYTLELTGASIDMDGFISEVAQCADILAVVRSGAMAIAHGKNVLTTEIGLGEGETKRGLLVFPKTKNEIQVLFQGKVEMAKLESIRIKGIGSKWKTDSGIKVGTTIEELVAINGKDFKFYGLEWDYSGRLVSWNGGKLDKKVSIFLEATNVEPVFPDLIGDKEFWSSNPKAIEAGLFVNSILIFF